MTLNYEKDVCKIAAEMLHTEPRLLDYRLAEYLIELDELVEITGGHVASRQIVALAILTWQHSINEDFTKHVGFGP